MRAVEENALAVLERAVDEQRCVGDHRPQALGIAFVRLEQPLELERLDAVDALEPDVLLGQRDLDLLGEDLGVEQILDADPEAVSLVRVRRADAAMRRTDLQLAQPALARAVDQRMPRHDEMRVPRQADEVGRDPARLEAVELLDHHLRVDNAAGADDALLAADDTGRDVLELVRLAVGDDRMARVGAAVVAADEVGVLRQQVDDFPLPSSPHCAPTITVAGTYPSVPYGEVRLPCGRHGARRCDARGGSG